jgi:DNA-binding CsgD family transcriptional regulator
VAGIAAALDGLGGLAHERGDRARAAALYEAALAEKRALGDRLGVAVSLDYLGTLAREQGDPARAAALFEEALACKRALGERAQAAFSLHNLSLAAYQLGDPARATAAAAEALALARELGSPVDAARRLEDLAAVVAAGGAPAQAARLLGAAAALRERLGAPPPNPAGLARTRATVAAALPGPAFAAAWAAGRVLSPEQAAAGALDDLPAAHARDGSSSPDAAQSVRARGAGPPGRSSPNPLSPGPPYPTGGDLRRHLRGLTARQVEVLRLVAQGHTDRQIAAELGLSEKTVGRHLESIFAKLGVSSRAAAAAAAVRLGLA